MALSDDGKLLYLGNGNGEINLFSVEEKAVVHTFSDAHFEPVCSLVLSEDNKRLYSSSYDGQIAIWNTETKENVKTLVDPASDKRVYQVIVSKDGSTIYSAGMDKLIKIWDVESGEIKNKMTGHDSEVFAIALSANEKLVFSGGLDASVKIWSMAKSKFLGDPRYFKFSKFGRELFKFNFADHVKIDDVIFDEAVLNDDDDEYTLTLECETGKLLTMDFKFDPNAPEEDPAGVKDKLKEMGITTEKTPDEEEAEGQTVSDLIKRGSLPVEKLREDAHFWDEVQAFAQNKGLKVSLASTIDNKGKVTDAIYLSYTNEEENGKNDIAALIKDFVSDYKPLPEKPAEEKNEEEKNEEADTKHSVEEKISKD